VFVALTGFAFVRDIVAFCAADPQEVASIGQTKEALQQENTTLREAMQHMQQALKVIQLSGFGWLSTFVV
jgi:hypothetical protein